MSGSSKIGGTSPTPEKVPGLGDVGGEGQSDLSGLLQTKVSTSGDLKSLLIAKLGEKDGTKFYNQFMTSFCMLLIQQAEQSARHAEEAAANMRKTP